MSDDVFAYLDPEPSPGSLAHPEAVWGQAREDYLGGDSAGVVCQRYGLSRSRFFERARAEGWRKSDHERGEESREAVEARLALQAEADAAFVGAAMQAAATPAYLLARRAWALAEQALLKRRRLEAASWVRIARDLRRMAMEEAGAASWKTTVQRCEPPPPEPPPAETAASAPPAASPPRAPPAPVRPTGLPSDIPMAAMQSPGKLARWLAGEIGEDAVRAIGLPGLSPPPRALRSGLPPDSPDQSHRTANSGSSPPLSGVGEGRGTGPPPA